MKAALEQLFIGIDVPINTGIHQLQQRLASQLNQHEQDCFSIEIRPHITLLFLGLVELSHLNPDNNLTLLLSSAAQTVPPCIDFYVTSELLLLGRNAVAVRVEDTKGHLTTLASYLQQQANTVQPLANKQHQSWLPHITLGRLCTTGKKIYADTIHHRLLPSHYLEHLTGSLWSASSLILYRARDRETIAAYELASGKQLACY